jgi:hypothetical protein
MKLLIKNRDHFINSFLIPLSRVGDSAVLSVEKEQIQSLITTSDNTVIVSASYQLEGNSSIKKLNIPDLKKLCRIIQCIEGESIELELNTNSISYNSSNVKFKYHLYDDSIISVPKLNLSKLDTLNYNGNFTISHTAIGALIKGSTIATETNKIYISFEGQTVKGELTDKSRSNIDSYGISISDDYTGSAINNHIPLNFELFRIISSMKFNFIKSKVAADTGVFIFDMSDNKTSIRFVISALAN